MRKRPPLAAFRLLLVALLATPCFGASPTIRFYGIADGLRFGCTTAPTGGPAVLVVGPQPGFANLSLSGSKYPYVVPSMVEVPTPGQLQDFAITGTWGTTGAERTRAWANDPATSTLVGWRDDPIGLPGAFCASKIWLWGRGPMLEVTIPNSVEHWCAVDWTFMGEERATPPKRPRGKWAGDPSRSWLQQQADLAAKPCGKRVDGVAAPATVSVAPCAAQTLCFASSPRSAPELLVRSRALPGGRIGVAYLPLSANASEVWSMRAGDPAESVRSWIVPPAPPSGSNRAGFLDSIGYSAPPELGSSDTELAGVADLAGAAGGEEGWSYAESGDGEQGEMDGTSTAARLDADALPSWEEEDLYDELQAGAPPAPDGAWLSTRALPGYRFKARLNGAALVQSGACPKQTLCLGTTAAVPAQLFARVTARQPNGKRWVLAGKFPDAAAELWVQQGTTGPVRYYALAARPASSPWLPAIADRLAFDK